MFLKKILLHDQQGYLNENLNLLNILKSILKLSFTARNLKDLKDTRKHGFEKPVEKINAWKKEDGFVDTFSV